MRRPDQRLADLRAQRAANLRGQAPDRRAGRADRPRPGCWRAWRRCSTTPSGAAATRSRRSPTGPTRRRTSSRPPTEPRSRCGSRSRSPASGSRSTSRARPPQVDGNLNCPLPVTRAATLFAIRSLTDPDAPASAGAFRPVAIAAPPGTVLNARPGAAVAAGNVETSSRVADLVFAALAERRRRARAGPGNDEQPDPLGASATASEEFTYYETIGGGQGACPGRAGAERRPRRDVEHAQHAGRGARGRAAGADHASSRSVAAAAAPAPEPAATAIVRRIEALAPLRFSLITERRSEGPRGRDGGGDGAPGRNTLNGEPLPAKCEGGIEARRRALGSRPPAAAASGPVPRRGGTRLMQDNVRDVTYLPFSRDLL